MTNRLTAAFCLTLVLIMSLLVGCSDQEKAATADPTDDQVNNPIEEPNVSPEEHDIPKELTADELQANFQKVYESCGSSRSQEDEQISLEVNALEKAAADIHAKLPENFETKYREWRSAKITALIEADRAVLVEEYAQIVAGRPVYAPAIEGVCEANPGLCYADYVDFDSDGLSELLLISVESAEEEPVKIEVYGLADGHAAQYGKLEKSVPASLTVALYKKGEQMSLGTSFWAGGTAYPTINSFYTVEDGTLAFSDKLFGTRDYSKSASNGWSYKYYSFSEDADDRSVDIMEENYLSNLPVKELTEEQYDSIYAQYTDRIEIFSGHNDWSADWTIPFTYEPGIAPAPPEPSITVNGEVVDLGGRLYGENGYVMAPMRPVLEKMGVAVCANSNLDTIIASTKKDTLEVYDDMRQWDEIGGEFYMNFNDEAADVYDTSAQRSMVLRMTDGQMIVPIDYVAELFGAHCSWDNESRTLVITSDIPAEDRMSSSEVSDMVNFTLEDAKRISEQYGYRFNPHPEHEWDAGGGYTNGKSYWWLCTLPTTISEDYANALFFSEEIDLYEYVTIWNDGTMTVK